MSVELRTNQDLDPRRLRDAFGAFPSGVVAVAASVEGVHTGLAASSFTSVSLDPPLVSFSVANSSRTWPDLRRASHLGLSVLAEQHAAVCRRLAGPVGRRFDGVAVTATATGALLLDDGLAHFECTVHREVPAGDHTLVLLEVRGAGHQEASLSTSLPLVFHRSSFGLAGRADP